MSHQMRNTLIATLTLAWLGGGTGSAAPVSLADVNGDTPMTVGLFSQIAEETLPSVVGVRVYAKLSESDLETLSKYKSFRDNPSEHLEDPDFRDFLERHLDPRFRQLDKFLDDSEDLTLSSGAGVILDTDGHIVTNRHVIDFGSARGDLEIRLYDGRSFRGDQVEVVAMSPLVDLAVLKIPPDNLTPARFGDSRATRIAEPVLAFGNPLDLANTVSDGIISATGRHIEKAVVEDHFQTTAMINPGNSGGALVNMRGEVIGINIAIATNSGRWQGIGFAVPSHIVHEVARNLIQSGREGFGYLGVQMTADAPSGERMRWLRWHGLTSGVVVEGVLEGGPSDKAGVLAEDIIVKVDGQETRENEELIQRVARRPIGDVVALSIKRPNESGGLDEVELQVTLGERPSQREISEIRSERQRLLEQARNDRPDSGEAPLGLEYAVEPEGLRVIRAMPGGIAERAGLIAGDMVMQVNRQNVRDDETLKAAIEALGSRSDHLIHFRRDGVLVWSLAPARPS